jgi:hypothetical protein
MECPASYDQIDRDLEPFPSINMEVVGPQLVAKFSDHGRHSLVHYKIIDNKVSLPFLHCAQNHSAEVHEREKYWSLTMVCVTCDSQGDFAILYLVQSLAPVPYGIDANDCQCVT